MNKTIKLTNSAVTAATSMVVVHPNYFERSESVSERIDKWFIQPLREMSGSQGFIVLMILLPLYEKHLRVKFQMDDDFSKGHKIFKTIGRHLSLSEEGAFEFWRHVRNGLLHKALPKESTQFKYGIREQGPPIDQNGDVFWINPFAMRDRLLEEIVPDTKTWKIDDVSLPKTFDHIFQR
jgi:hypothetical protein